MAGAAEHEQRNASRWRLMGELLPFDEGDTFTFADLGTGTGAAARTVLELYPRSTAILADLSPRMMVGGAAQMQPFAGRFEYVTFDMQAAEWPNAIPMVLDAVVTSMCIHHLPDHRKRGLFAEIFERLVPGGWYVNYDSVSAVDPVVEAAWARASDRLETPTARDVHPRTALEQASHEDHVRHMAPLARQLEYLRLAGFDGIDVYWKRLDDVILAGRRPS
ncbi:MAG: class I SAM-dependent methyltransferase [Actinomycetales bacterium]|nr:class I SAM-dependent methyltransferase [Actinomycetales bacterium]